MFEQYIFVLQVLTTITGFVCIRRGGSVISWLMFTGVLLVFINEQVIVPNSYAWWNIPRNTFYNIYAFVDITMWMAVFITLFSKNRQQKILVVVSWMVLMLMAIVETANHGFNELNVLSLSIFCVISIFWAMAYFTKLLQYSYCNFKQDEGFWLCAAVMTFHPLLLLNLFTIADATYWTNSNAIRFFDALQCIGISLYNLFICATFLVSFFRQRSSNLHHIL